MDNAGSTPPKCPCGFWGSPQTLNLCSKCYKDELQRKGKQEQRNAAVSENKSKIQVSNRKQSKQDLGKEPWSTEPNCEIQLDRNNSKCMKTETVTAAEGKGSQETSEEQESSNNTTENKPDVSKDAPVQKKRKRCWTCNAKLELAQRELGNCRCSYVFCQLHRLPEQHNCVFDHKESGRQEARKKMVSPGPKKVGRSFQRIDE